jgi:hypothetical protein
LTWHLNEIFFNWSSGEATILSFRAHIMHNMSKLMEEGHYFTMT